MFQEWIDEIDIVVWVGLNPFKKLTANKAGFFFEFPR